MDPVAGKSINAIRAFRQGHAGLGRPHLAGNDNEWRYISVRRFFNMVEESVKKSTYWAVFESNDANTWVKVRGHDRELPHPEVARRALAGATTEGRLFVRCASG